LAFGLAVRYEAIHRNPVRETVRLRKPPSTAMALTVDQVEAIRYAVRSWRRGAGLSGPKPDGQLEAIIEVMLGTSARIGEVLAIRMSATLENEAIATVENEATQTDWMGDLCGGLGSDSATGCGRCSAAPGRAGLGHRQVDCRAGVGV
ncbi:MAG: hypothetical protein U0R28_13945, partial [Candidatus Nanopelagicales bacterium]